MTDLPRPAASPPRAYHFPAVDRASLANGLGVVTARVPKLPLVTVLALVDAGAVRDPRGREGIAGLTVNTMSEGAGGLDGAELTERFELLGTALTTDADWDSATLMTTVTPDRLDAAVALLGTVLCSPAFTAKDVDRGRAERLANLLQLQAEPRELADDRFSEFLYVPGSRYGQPDGGSPSSVRLLDAAQVRAFHRAHFVPGATKLLFVGDVTPAKAMDLSQRTLGAWAGAAPARQPVDDRTTPGGCRVVIVNKSDAPQSELRIGHRGVPRAHPDYFAIVVMNALLGGLFSSRINLNLRERHAFTYGAQSAFEWRREAGPFVISTAVKTEVTGAATTEILKEVRRMRDDTIAPEELSLATMYLDGVFPIRYETTQAVAEALAAADVYGLGEDYFDNYRERIRRVTPADVRRSAREYLHPEDLLILAVGDASVIRAPLESLGLGSPEVHEATESGRPT